MRTSEGSVAEVARVFLRLGFTAFGGPAAHLAMMEEEVVRRRKWVDHEEFLDMIGAANLVPGPNSTEVAIHLGLRRAGAAGMLVAGACFILPAAFIVGLIAWAYLRYGALPQFESILYGIKPVVIAVVAQAIWSLAAKALDTWPKRIILGLGMMLAFLRVPELATLLGAGFILGGPAALRERNWRATAPMIATVGVVAVFGLAAYGIEGLVHGPAAPTPLALFLAFLKLGAVLYGSGYVLLAFLERDLVNTWHWLPKSEILNAVAIGQFTPGPVFTTATFIGYLLAGPAGAAAATIGIFLPSFLFVLVGRRLIAGLRGAAASSAFLDGVNAAALALMTVVLFRLGTDALKDVWTVAIALLAAFLLIRFKVNSAILILGGGLAGFLLSFVSYR